MTKVGASVIPRNSSRYAARVARDTPNGKRADEQPTPLDENLVDKSTSEQNDTDRDDNTQLDEAE